MYRNGDVTINKITLSSLDGKRTLDVRPQVSLINIYESITQPVVVGDITFVDYIGLLNFFPLIGEEVLDIEFLTPGLEKFTYKFHVTKYSDPQPADNSKGFIYNAEIVSKQGVINSTRLISQRMNNNISASIQSIIDQHFPGTNANIEQTAGIDNYLQSNVTPLQMIDALRKRAVSDRWKSSSFVFYQDRSAFHFACLESMINKSSDPKFYYNYDDSFDHDITTDNRFMNIIAYSPVQVADTIGKLQNGGSANIVKRFDIVTGQVTDIAYSDSNDIFAKSGSTSREQTNAFNQQFAQSTSYKPLIAFDSNAGEMLTEKASNLPGFVNRINQNIVNIAIYGNSSLLVGDCLQVDVSSMTGMTGPDNKSTTNLYIASKIRHIISVSDHSNYSMSVELIGNSLQK